MDLSMKCGLKCQFLCRWAWKIPLSVPCEIMFIQRPKDHRQRCHIRRLEPKNDFEKSHCYAKGGTPKHFMIIFLLLDKTRIIIDLRMDFICPGCFDPQPVSGIIRGVQQVLKWNINHTFHFPVWRELLLTPYPADHWKNHPLKHDQPLLRKGS